MKNKNLLSYINFVAILLLIATNLLKAQLSAPSVQSVYGGTINGIAAVSTGANSSRVFIATESANSVFYADITTTPSSEVFNSFTVMPGLGDDDGYGTNISKLFAHQASGYLFFIQNNTLYKTIYTGSSVSIVESASVSDFFIYNDYIYYIKGSTFYYGQINASGDIVVGSTGSFAIGASPTSPVIRISSNNNKLYIADLSTPAIYKSNHDYNSLSGSSSFSALTLGVLNGSVTSWDAFGIGPDGTLFLGGDDNSNKYVQYSTDDGSNWSGGATSINGVGGTNFSFGALSSPYIVYFAKCYATYTNGSGFGTWSEFGNASFETHPNDGPVFVDPNNNLIVYLTTDQGIGATENGGANIFEINDGVEAVQVNDFSMNSGKTIAWLASKAGVRKVTDYSTTPVWTVAMFPNNDGSPYYSAEMENDNDATAYVGNSRVYKTTDSGSNWTQVLSEGTTGYPSVGTQIEAIEVCPTNSSLVLAGFYVVGSTTGGLWYSTNSGSSWSQLQLKSGTTLPNDVDVYDIDFTSEGGIPVAYIGVEYDSTTSARSVYRAEYNSGWTVRQDFDGSYTAVGYAITATIMDVNVAGNYVYVCGTDAGSNHPIVYSRDHTADYTTSAGKWTTLTTTGFPTSQEGKAVAVGGGVVYCAVGNIIYTIPETSGTTWAVGHTYPTGTEINVLFYDDLLAGTGTGLYGHEYSGPLPVELVSFNGVAKDNFQVELNWVTATEVNNYGFNVERRTENEEWKNIAFVQGNGNSNSPKEYSYTDQPNGGKEFSYRLKQIDFDGSYEYSGEITVTMEEIKEYKLYQNYPNPFNPETIISYSLPTQSYVRLKVYDMLGREIATLIDKQQDAGNYITTFNTQDYLLSSGVYYIVLQSGNFTETKKCILIK